MRRNPPLQSQTESSYHSTAVENRGEAPRAKNEETRGQSEGTLRTPQSPTSSRQPAAQNERLDRGRTLLRAALRAWALGIAVLGVCGMESLTLRGAEAQCVLAPGVAKARCVLTPGVARADCVRVEARAHATCASGVQCEASVSRSQRLTLDRRTIRLERRTARHLRRWARTERRVTVPTWFEATACVPTSGALPPAAPAPAACAPQSSS